MLKPLNNYHINVYSYDKPVVDPEILEGVSKKNDHAWKMKNLFWPHPSVSKYCKDSLDKKKKLTQFFGRLVNERF